MKDNSLVEILSIVLQMLATILIALEYYLDKKKLYRLAKNFKQNIKISKNNRDNEVIDKLNQHKKNKKRYRRIIKFSIFILFVFSIIVYYILHEKLVEDTPIYLIVGILILDFSMLIFVLYLVKFLDPLIEYLVTFLLFTFPQNSILIAKKSVFVGLGVFMLFLSFILNLAEIIGVGIEVVKLIAFFTIVIVVFYLSLLVKSYKM